MVEQRKVANISLVEPTTGDDNGVTIGLNEEGGHFRILLSKSQAIEVGLRALAAATADRGAVPVTEFGTGSFPDGTTVLTLHLGSGSRLRFMFEVAAVKDLRDALAEIIDQAVKPTQTGNETLQ